MPTPPLSIPVTVPLPAISTPAINLPCSRPIPSIPLIAPFTFTLTLPSFSLLPLKKLRKGPKNTKKKGKNGGTGETIAQKIARCQKWCSENAKPRPPKEAAPPPPPVMVVEAVGPIPPNAV